MLGLDLDDKIHGAITASRMRCARGLVPSAVTTSDRDGGSDITFLAEVKQSVQRRGRDETVTECKQGRVFTGTRGVSDRVGGRNRLAGEGATGLHVLGTKEMTRGVEVGP